MGEVSSDSEGEELELDAVYDKQNTEEPSGTEVVGNSENQTVATEEAVAVPSDNVQNAQAFTEGLLTEALNPTAGGGTTVDIRQTSIEQLTTGPTIIINHQSSVERKPDENGAPTGFPILNKEILSKKIKQVTEDIRFYYQTNLIVLSPLPWVQLRPFNDDYFAELVIKQISHVGRGEIKARNEFSFREIFKDSQSNQFRHCILVEGSPGYGKTTLARNIAVDWGRKADYVSKFSLVVFIYCRDLKGRNLEKYVAETFPMVENGDKPVNLKDWFTVRTKILFILDGLDECSPVDAQEINKLLTGKTYAGASILATTRPLGKDTMIHHCQFSKNVSIKGFNKEQIEKLIDHHFKEREGMGDKLKQMLFAGDKGYQKLVSCPLLCQL